MLVPSPGTIAKSRIDPELKRQAEAVPEEIGLKPRAALELFCPRSLQMSQIRQALVRQGILEFIFQGLGQLFETHEQGAEEVVHPVRVELTTF